MGSKIDVEWTNILGNKEFLGEGASSRVYLAESTDDKKLYVVKEMLT